MIHAKSYATVCLIEGITPHPNADRLEVIQVRSRDDAGELVTGKHYRSGDAGIWIRPGALIPGWLAHDLWLVGKTRANEPFVVREMPIRGVFSPGLWCGQWYKNDSSKESIQRGYEMASHPKGLYIDGWTRWPLWNDEWEFGDSVDAELGIHPLRPLSSAAEQPVVNRQVADGQNADLGATPAVGSKPSHL